MRNFLVILALTALAGCAAPRTVTDNMPYGYFGGWIMFAPNPDSVSFADCATGITFAVERDGDYKRLRRIYLSQGRRAEAVYAEFEGVVVADGQPVRWPAWNSGRRALRIENFLAFDGWDGCDPEFVVPGIYENISDGQRTVIRAVPDYTCEVTRLNGSDTTFHKRGRWYMTARHRMIIKERPTGTEADLPKGTDPLFFFDMPAEYHVDATEATLTTTDGSKVYVYNKVYLR